MDKKQRKKLRNEGVVKKPKAREANNLKSWTNFPITTQDKSKRLKANWLCMICCQECRIS